MNDCHMARTCQLESEVELSMYVHIGEGEAILSDYQ